MAQILKYQLTSDGSKLIPLRTSFDAIATQLKPNIVYDFTISEEKDKRTTRQNSYFHYLVTWWNNETKVRDGNIFTPEQAKTVMKMAIGWYDKVVIKHNGKEYPRKVPRATADLPKDAFNNLLDLLANWTLEEWGLTPPKWEI